MNHESFPMKPTVSAIRIFALVTMLFTAGAAFSDNVQYKLQTLENAYRAGALTEEDYQKKFPLRVLKKDLESNEFLLSISEVEGKPQYERLLVVHKCEDCEAEFTLLDKFQLNNCRGWTSQCIECANKPREQVKIPEGCDDDYYYAGDQPPVIYKITNKLTGKCYIGKTLRSFTLRWYEHFFQGTGPKFEEAINGSKYSDWTFEVLEVVDIKKPDNSFLAEGDREMRERNMSEREQFYIDKYDSIKNGYNCFNHFEVE